MPRQAKRTRVKRGKGRLFALIAIAAASAITASAAERCARCHPAEVAGFEATAMAHSVSMPGPEPAGSFIHKASATQFSVEYRDGALHQRLERRGLSADYEMAYAVGSGSHAISYLIDLRGHLFQSPLCYYPGRARWDMAPGYETSAAPDFYRPIVPHCLYCHAGSALPIAGTLNTYQNPAFAAQGITCERCHGPAEAHLRNPVPGSIVNPAKLPQAARDSVCEQCHLSGEAFITNPGKRFTDFRPGENLEAVFSVYVFKSSRDPKHPDALTVISQSQQLALSKCARMSGGALWCATCHDPHQQPVDPVAYYRVRCLECHASPLPKNHPARTSDCIGCHMPQLPVENGGHTIFTDHRIAIYSPQAIAAGASPPPAMSPSSGAGDLVPWRDPGPELAGRNLGLADVEVGERTKSVAMIARGYNLLVKCLPKFPNDPVVLTAVAQVLLGGHHNAEAESMFQRVIQLEPGDASNYLHAGLAWEAAGDDQKAITFFEKALQLDPLLEQPYRELAAIYSAEGNTAMLHEARKRYLAAFPKKLAVQRAAR